MEIFELIVKTSFYEVSRPGEPKRVKFATVLGAFTYAQLTMSEDTGEILVHGDGIEDACAFVSNNRVSDCRITP